MLGAIRRSHPVLRACLHIDCARLCRSYGLGSFCAYRQEEEKSVAFGKATSGLRGFGLSRRSLAVPIKHLDRLHAEERIDADAGYGGGKEGQGGAR
jgi:hypothetical protein